MNQKLVELRNNISGKMLPIHNEINEVLNKVNSAGITGNVSRKQLKRLLEETKDSVCKLIVWYRNGEELVGESHEEQIFVLVEYTKVIESGLLLMQEMDKKFENADNLAKTLSNVVNTVADCGNSIGMNVLEITKINVENVVNDLVDKILLVETKYNEGNLTIEKAYKHVQKIKNTFKTYNIQKTGNKDIDNEIEFLNYAIEESEKMYASENQVETTETSSVSEFLDEATEQTIEDLNNDTQNLTNCLNQLNNELPHNTQTIGIDLDWLYNQIKQINELTATNSTTNYDSIHGPISYLDRTIDELRQQTLNISFHFNDCSEISQTAISMAESLKEKNLTARKEIISNENSKRIQKISTQLDSLAEITEVNDAEYLVKVNTLLVNQSNRCLETNPELQQQIKANQEKSKTIGQKIEITA